MIFSGRATGASNFTCESGIAAVEPAAPPRREASLSQAAITSDMSEGASGTSAANGTTASPTRIPDCPGAPALEKRTSLMSGPFGSVVAGDARTILPPRDRRQGLGPTRVRSAEGLERLLDGDFGSVFVLADLQIERELLA